MCKGQEVGLGRVLGAEAGVVGAWPGVGRLAGAGTAAFSSAHSLPRVEHLLGARCTSPCPHSHCRVGCCSNPWCAWHSERPSNWPAVTQPGSGRASMEPSHRVVSEVREARRGPGVPTEHSPALKAQLFCL